MSLEHFGDWMIDAPTNGGPTRLYHVHAAGNGDEKNWKTLSGVIDGKCRTCDEPAPKSLRFRVAFWGIDGSERPARNG